MMITSWKCRPRNSAGLVCLTKSTYQILTLRLQHIRQVGMYSWMAIMRFAVFGHEISKTNPAFWFLMQIGMATGFLTSYPVNWWLVNRGIKERM